MSLCSVMLLYQSADLSAAAEAVLDNVENVREIKIAHSVTSKKMCVPMCFIAYLPQLVKQFLIISIMLEKSNPHIIFTSLNLFPKGIIPFRINLIIALIKGIFKL